MVEKKSNEELGSSSEIQVGIVKWYNQDKGFGFIEQANGRDLFLHYKELRGSVKSGDQVRFMVGEGRKGPCACKVTKLP